MSETQASEASTKIPRPTEILRAADEEILEADRRLQELEAAVAAGDDSIELEHVEAARKQSAWARLRRKGAEAKAERAAQAQREARYDALVAKLLPRIEVDHSARATELLGQAKASLEELFELNTDRNAAIVQLARYLEDESNFRRPQDQLSGHTESAGLGFTEVWIRGRRHEFKPPSDYVRRLVGSVRKRVDTLSGGAAPEGY